MSFQKDRSISQYRISMLRERVASLKEENATMKQRERSLEDAKEQVQILSSHSILSD